MSWKDKFCQSCGMPMDKDPGKGGTEKDGAKSLMYCSYCYENGAFRDNFTTGDQMKAFVKEQLKKQGIGPLRRWFFTLSIPKLDRWKK